MKKLLIYLGAITNWAIFGVIAIHFMAFLRPMYIMGMILGITKFQGFFFGGGGGYA